MRPVCGVTRNAAEKTLFWPLPSSDGVGRHRLIFLNRQAAFDRIPERSRISLI